VKVIDTSNVEKDGALEALMEIEIMSELDSPYIVSYLDSFIIDSQINIVM
jgi:serine/threonine protein kinase